MEMISCISGLSARDPHITKYNGKYYRCYTEDSASVSIACGDSIESLLQAKGKKVYIPEVGKAYSKELWAPELHIIDDKCYIYVACDDGDNKNHRMYVLENHSSDPLNDYKMHGKIQEKNDKWAIDGTVMKYNNKDYYIWSGWEGDENRCQNLYIAEMDSPCSLSTERSMISTPEYDWEKLGSKGDSDAPYVNEGAYAFSHLGKHYLTYSAAGSWCTDYCIALLELTGENPLDKNSWTKHSLPILSKNDAVQGAGHCSLICDNGEIHVFFHGWKKTEKVIRWDTVYLWHAKLKKTDAGFVLL